MAKGVKKIKLAKIGNAKSSMSVPGKKALVEGGVRSYFQVDSWYNETTEEDKKKSVTWILQDRKANTVILQKRQLPSNAQAVLIPKNLCGPFEFYLEASLSGKRDLYNDTGLYISGDCPAKIIGSKWCITNDADDVRKTHFFSYGENVYLNLTTQGLNGHKNLRLDIFRRLPLKTDKLFRSIASVAVTDGEINIEISNTYSWYFDVKHSTGSEEFYIKLYDPITKQYIVDDKQDTAHARYLRIKNKIVSSQTKPPTNLSPLKTGVPKKNVERYELCKFETITIIDNKYEDGKTSKIKTLVFDNGKNLKDSANPKTQINKTILFEFGKNVITAEAKTVIENILQFLLSTQFSTIKIDGHACVIGKEQYNQKLSQQRSDAVKKLFVAGGLDASRIISIGRGEVNPTDDKQGRDNIKYKDEKEYKENRRVDIAFEAYGHNAQTIVYETVAPSHNEDITIDVTGFDNKACFNEKGKHKKNIKINSTEYSTSIDEVTNSLAFPIKSNLTWWNIAPLQYIWPKVLANQYDIYVHSCRYFSTDSNPTIQAMVYSDIKWNLQLAFNWEHPFAYTHGNLPEYSRKDPKDPKVAKIIREEREAHSKAVGAGKEAKKVANSPEMLTKFELKLEGKWGGQSFELSTEFAKKIRNVLNVFIKYKEIADKVKDALGGVPKGAVLSKTPFMFDIQSPSLNANIDWYLEKGTGINAAKVATVGKLNFKADPLIGAKFTIDLLASVSKMNPVVAAFIGSLEGALSAANGGITLEAIFTGSLNFDFNAVEFNSLTGIVKGGSLDLGAKLEINILLEIHASIKSKSYAKEPFLRLHAAGKMDAYFAAKMKVDCDEKGIYYQPEVGFSGMIFTFEIEVEIRGHKKVRRFSNEDEPFLKPEPYTGEKHYLPLNNKNNIDTNSRKGGGSGW